MHKLLTIASCNVLNVASLCEVLNVVCMCVSILCLSAGLQLIFSSLCIFSPCSNYVLYLLFFMLASYCRTSIAFSAAHYRF
jgi:hypothetical protein